MFIPPPDWPPGNFLIDFQGRRLGVEPGRSSEV